MKNTQLLVGYLSLSIEKNHSWLKYLGAVYIEKKSWNWEYDEL